MGYFFYLDPTLGNGGSVDFSRAIDPAGCGVAGSYHTHPFVRNDDFESSYFSGLVDAPGSGDRAANIHYRAAGRDLSFPLPPYVGYLGTAEGLFFAHELPGHVERALSPLGSASPAPRYPR